MGTEDRPSSRTMDCGRRPGAQTGGHPVRHLARRHDLSSAANGCAAGGDDVAEAFCTGTDRRIRASECPWTESAKHRLGLVVRWRHDPVVKNAPRRRMRTNAPTSADIRMRHLVARFPIAAFGEFRSTTTAADGTRRQPARTDLCPDQRATSYYRCCAGRKRSDGMAKRARSWKRWIRIQTKPDPYASPRLSSSLHVVRAVDRTREPASRPAKAHFFFLLSKGRSRQISPDRRKS
jgi:hypothetical protein